MIKFEPIKIIGIGGAGSLIAELCYKEKLKDTEIIAVDSTKLSLKGTKANKKIIFKNEEGIKELISNTELLFLCSCLGGQTGSSITPIIAKIAQKLKITTIPIITMPLEIEGTNTNKKAKSSLSKLRKCSDKVLIVDNNKFPGIDDMTVSKAMKNINKSIVDTIKGIIETIVDQHLVSLDVSDFKIVMKGKGIGTIGFAEAKGKLRTKKAVKSAMSNLLYPINNKKISGAIILTKGGSDLSLDEVSRVGELVCENLKDKADVIWSAEIKDKFKKKLKLNIVFVTGEKK